MREIELKNGTIVVGYDKAQKEYYASPISYQGKSCIEGNITTFRGSYAISDVGLITRDKNGNEDFIMLTEGRDGEEASLKSILPGEHKMHIHYLGTISDVAEEICHVIYYTSRDSKRTTQVTLLIDQRGEEWFSQDAVTSLSIAPLVFE